MYNPAKGYSLGNTMINQPGLRNTISLLLALGLTACSVNPFNNNNHPTGTVVGSVVGGTAGVGTVAALGTSSKVWMGLGGLAGAGIGYYVTTLRFAAGGIIQGGGQVYTQGEYATLEIPADKLFEVNSSDLLPDAESILKSAVAVLNRYPSHNIMISGNTSGFGTSRFERKLSEDRARETAAFLWANGVTGLKFQSLDCRKLTYVGYGNYFPIANSITNAGIRSNSRIQITAYPTKDQLLIDKKQRGFNNIGDINEPRLKTEPTVNADNDFPTSEKLPEEPTNHAEDFKDTLNEFPLKEASISPNEAQSSGYFAENANTNFTDKNENAPNYNKIESSDQTKAGGSIAKQGGFTGYKGDGLKGE
jgi:outer membrane protein OmpA-like peptidoglycan-associated protein